MKLKLLGIVLVLATAAQAATLTPDAQDRNALKPDAREAKVARMAADLMSHHHYKALPLDESLSNKIFDQYLKALDPEKLFFVQDDINRLSSARSQLGSDMLHEDLGDPFTIYNLYVKRANERFVYARSLLKTGFNFQEAETYQFERDKQDWPKNDAQARDLWRKRVKNEWLRLKLGGKDEKAIFEVLDKRYDNILKRMAKVNSEDAFQTYMNAYTMAIEPHTNYLLPRVAENFDISMRLSLTGIGAVLSEVDEYTTIRELVAGAPAILSGQLKVGDRIVGVAQGENGPMADIIGVRLDDSVSLIRGAQDTVVRLEVLPADAGPDAKHKLVTLVRKPISLQEQAAKSAVQTITVGKTTHRVGVITLPSFYEDFAGRQKGSKDYRSASRDVAQLLDELKKKKVDSILVDLRNNGGGSLTQAVDLTGLFVGKGPVVQTRNAKGSVQIENSQRADVAWDGPLGVLIDRASASASEIFAAAIQDYGRGLIIGEPSFGKGTVQTMFDLDRMTNGDNAKLGELKFTIAQFFRVNGGTTQLRGVTPDIAFPNVIDASSFGESSYDNALPYTQIKPANYTPIGDLQGLVPILSALHETRIRSDKDFQYLQSDIAEVNQRRKKNEISLNETERRKERDAQEAKLAARKPAAAGGKSAQKDVAAVDADASVAGGARDDGLQAGERKLSVELAAEKARKNEKDVLLLEAVHIMGDEVDVLSANPSLAARGAIANGRAGPGAGGPAMDARR